MEPKTTAAVDALSHKQALLEESLRALRSAVVAFSGGLDSTLLLKVAARTLGLSRVLAVTARSPSLPKGASAEAPVIAAEIGAAHEFLDTREFENPAYTANAADRCYHCKSDVYQRLVSLAAARGFEAVVCGTNADDLRDYRPGLRAAAERGVRSPLAEAGLTKSEIRQLAARLGISIYDRPASPCLSSRVPYGEPITAEKLGRIDAAESFLRGLGFAECRVRHHERLARIEVPAAELARFADERLRAEVDRRLGELGFVYVALDLRGFRSGSLNEVLPPGAEG